MEIIPLIFGIKKKTTGSAKIFFTLCSQTYGLFTWSYLNLLELIDTNYWNLSKVIETYLN